MRPPITWGDLLPVLIPGLIVLGAASMLVMQTPLGPLVFGGNLVFLLLSLLVGALVVGYLVSGLQEVLTRIVPAWALPPTSHLGARIHGVTLPRLAVEQAGFRSEASTVTLPLGDAYALERSLAGAWGTPETAGWDRVAFLQRLSLALALAALLAAAFLAWGLLGSGVDAGLRSHGLTVLLLGGATAALVGQRSATARREAIINLLADARALLMDRGEHQEVRRVLTDAGLSLEGEDPGFEVPR